MNSVQLEAIPDRLLKQRGTRDLREYLYYRGLRMTLEELHQERRRRGITVRM